MERQCGAACGQQGVPAFLSGSARVSCPAVESDIKLPDTQKIIYAAGDGPRWQRLVLGRKGQMHGNEMIYIIEEPFVDDGSGSEKSFFCRLEQKLDDTSVVVRMFYYIRSKTKPDGSMTIVAAGMDTARIYR